MYKVILNKGIRPTTIRKQSSKNF